MRKLLFILLLAPLLSFGQTDTCQGVWEVDYASTTANYNGSYIFGAIGVPTDPIMNPCISHVGFLKYRPSDSILMVYTGYNWIPVAAQGAGSGTVTQVTFGYGLLGGTVTSTGTGYVDTTKIPTYYYLYGNYYTQAEIANLVNARKLKGDTINIDGYKTNRLAAIDIHDSITSNQITAGYGLSKSGNALSVDTPTIARTAQLAAYKLGNDSTGATGYVPQYQIDTIKANLRAAIASGTADSVIYATMHRLDTVKANLRAQIAAGTADSTVFATLFRLDTAKLNLLAYIATKQSQLNGTGFVKAAGTTISYDNSVYVTSVSGTTNRITSTGGATPVIDISSTFEAAITTQTVTTASYTTSVTISSSVASPMSTVNYAITAQAGTLLFNNPAGSWANGQILIIRIKDNGTNRALTYGPNFRGGTLTLPSTTTTGQTLSMQFVYNSTDTKFDLVGFVSNY